MQNRENRKLLKSGMSVSLNSIPVVTVTESETPRAGGEDTPDIRGSQSHPCSPRYKRRAFTTTIAGTKYVIETQNQLFCLQIVTDVPYDVDVGYCAFPEKWPKMESICRQ